MIFELTQDFSDAVVAMPTDHPKRQMLGLLEEAVRRDIHFIDRHPTTLFQCMWNTCWWYDCPEATESDAFGHLWLDEKQHQTPNFRWLRLEQTSRPSGLYHSTIPIEGESVGGAISDEGDRLIIGSEERVRMIDTNNNREILNIPISVRPRYSAATISPEGSLLGYAQRSDGGNATCLVLNANSGRQLPAFCIPYGEILSLAFSSNGTMLAACGVSNRDGWLGVFDLHRSELLWEHSIPGRLMRKVIFTCDDSNIIVAGGDGVCSIWSIASDVNLKDIPCHTGGVSDISLSPSGDSVLSVGKDGVCRIWSTMIKRRRVRIKSVLDSLPDEPFIAGAFLDNSSIAVADFAGNVFHFSLSGPSTPIKILGCGRGMVRLASDDDGSCLMITSSGDQQCHVIDVADALKVGGLESPRAQAVDFTNNGQSVTITQNAGQIRFLDINGPDWEQQASQPSASLGVPIAVSAVSSSRFHLLVARDGQWWLMDTVSQTEEQGKFSLEMKDGSIVSVSPDGRIICAFVREKVEFVNVATGNRSTFSLAMIPRAIRLSEEGTALVLGHGCRFSELWPRDIIAIWFQPLVSDNHKKAGPFGVELATDNFDLVISEDDIFMTSRSATGGGSEVNLWDLKTLEQTAERCFSKPARLLCLRSDCKQAVVYIPTLSVCHIVDTTTPRLDDLGILPVANALDVASIRPAGDRVIICNQQGTVSLFRAMGR